MYQDPIASLKPLGLVIYLAFSYTSNGYDDGKFGDNFTKVTKVTLV